MNKSVADRLNSLHTFEPDSSGISEQIFLDALPCETVAIDAAGYIVKANRAFCEAKGISLESCVGTDIRQLGTCTGILQALEYQNETKLMFKEGNDSIVLCSIFADGKAVGAAELRFRNCTSVSAASPKLGYTHMEEDINKLFETNWDVIYASDSNGITLEVSSAAKTLWGMDPESLVGKSVYELEKKRIFYPSITKMVLESKRRVQAIQTTATGKKLLVLGTPIKDEDGSIVRVINTSRLIMNENELFNELQETRLLLDGYKRELEQSRLNEQKNIPFVARSPQMQKVVSLALKVSETDIPVLITGESGVGKEVLANFINSKSPRAGKPYIKINCSAIPPSLLESEMFGYERGAFTGAERSGKPGIFELANNGTLFLDEVSEIPITMQAKFLRVLQENEFMRVGGTKAIPVNVRIIAATNKDLQKEIEKGNFRKDLFYRLNVVQITIPSLRERKDDILPLSLYFLEKYNLKYHLNRSFAPEVIEAFHNYSWDGNTRELQNTIERMVVLSQNDIISQELLPELVISHKSDEIIQVSEIIPLRDAQQYVEEKLIQLAKSKYKTTSQIAEALGVDQSTISRKLRKEK